jgi:hypothetical protein
MLAVETALVRPCATARDELWGRQSCLQPAFEPAPPWTCKPDEPAAARFGCPTVPRVGLAVLVFQVAFAQTWVMQQTGTSASLRGVSAVSDRVVWASGSGGTWIRTTDGGATWHAAIVPGAETLDFRGIHAIDATTAWLLSSGPGDKSRIYKTTDAGGHWTLQYTNPDAKGFFDAIAFWNPAHGVVVGDPVDGQFVILTTDDGGTTWKRQATPAALPNEGAFAASNTCLRVSGSGGVWFGTGGPGAARVFRSKDGGRSWTIATTQIRNDGASAGISPAHSPTLAMASRLAAITRNPRRPPRTLRLQRTAVQLGPHRLGRDRTGSDRRLSTSPAAGRGSQPAPRGPTFPWTMVRTGNNSIPKRTTRWVEQGRMRSGW